MNLEGRLDMDALSPTEVLHLYRRHAISDGEYQRAVERVTLPPPPSSWENVLRQVFLVFAVLLIVSGIILFGAYNWEALPRLAKLGLVQVLLLGFWLFSRLRPEGSLESKAALWGASLLVGAHMAVFGQVYQTGADSYTLFAVWSALLIPWCLAGRTNLLWLTQAVLLNFAFSLYFFQRLSQDFPIYSIGFAILNVILATLWHVALKNRSWMSPSLRSLLLTAALVPITGASCLAPWEGERYALCFFLNMLLVGALVRLFPDDFPIMAPAASSGLTLCSALLCRVLLEMGTFGFFMIAVSIVGLLAATIGWLRKVHARQAGSKTGPTVPTFEDNSADIIPRPAEELGRTEAPEPTDLPRPERRHSLTPLQILDSQGLLDVPLSQRPVVEPDAPFYLGCLTAIGAWIASLFFLAFIAALALNDDSALTVVGLLLWGGSIRGRRGELSDFFNQLFFAVHMAGGFMILGGLSQLLKTTDDYSMLLLALLLQTASLILFPDTVARGLCSLGVVVTGSFLGHEISGGLGMSVWLLMAAAGLTLLLSAQARLLLSRWRDFYRPALSGATLGLLTMIGAHSFEPRWVWGGETLTSWLLVTGLAALTAYAAFHSRLPIPALPALLVLDAVTFTVPGLSAAVLVFVLAFHSRNNDILRMSLLAVLVFGIEYYYDLELSFLLKSVTLIASGLILLATRRLLQSERGEAL